ncbi:DUF2304 domain-containing protein [Pseudobutyrivibrio sp. LB2011]|uniref:DUF2304 domain-containing protein n=1 Tax=Pseudobutyrivibrio sp. LB2011 TaxID=1408312 RepID=UPI0005D18B95|nr:DUF2304 domain-containing protein [Pseudobutyrivibrio sp. LB2011]
MSSILRVIILLLSLLLFIFVYRKLKKSQLSLMDALYWILFSFAVLLLGVFPVIGDKLASITGVASTANFLFLSMIFLLIIRSFLLTIKVSILEHKISSLVQEIAIRERQYCKIEDIEGNSDDI